MKKLVTLIAGMALVGGVQAADLSILDGVASSETVMMTATEMEATQGMYYGCCDYGQDNYLGQWAQSNLESVGMNTGFGNGNGATQYNSNGNSATQINDASSTYYDYYPYWY